MIENFINKIISKPESFCYKDGDYLREWQKDLVFYWSGEQEKADYALVDKSPKLDRLPEIHTDGKFGSYSKIKSPVNFKGENFQCLNDNINISFWLGANVVNGFYTVYLTPKENFKISKGDYSFFIQVDGEISHQVILNLEEGETFVDLANHLLFELDPGFYNVGVDPDQTSDSVIAISSAISGKTFSLYEGTDGTDLLSLVNHEKSNYGTIPSKEFFDIIRLGDDEDYLTITHTREKEDTLLLSKLRFTYKVGETLKTTSVEWNNNGLSLDHVEVDIDSSVMYIFINGNLEKAVLINPIKRIAKNTPLIINGSEEDFYSIEELIVKSKLQNKENFIPPEAQITKYDTTIPYIDYYYNGKKFGANSKFELKDNTSNGISMVFNYNGVFYNYSNGSWRQSDGSFEQSNDHFTFVDSLKSFTFNESEDMFIRAYFESDGSDEQFVKDLYFDLSSEGIYENNGRTAAILVGIPTFEPEQEMLPPDIPEIGPDYPYYDPSPDDLYPEEGELIPQNIELNGKELTIKTDLGTTKMVFPKDMTIDEAMKYIEDTYPEGIAKSYVDSKYRGVLVSETKGDTAFIKVSGAAGDLIFGEAKSAQGIDNEKNTLNNDYKDFIEMVKKYASNDLIPIEIDDDQIRLYINEAINLYKKYRNDEINTYSIQLEGSPEEGYEIPPVVQDWHDITDIIFRPLFPVGFYSGSFDNDAEDIIELSLVNAIGGVDYSQFYGKGFQTDYYISLMNISSMEQILGLTPSWEVLNNRLFIYPNTISKYTTVTIKYKAPVDPKKALRDNMIQKFVAGRIRMAQGEIRGSMGGNLSSGGLAVQFNADAMYERGKALVDEATEEMKKEQMPMGFIVG